MTVGGKSPGRRRGAEESAVVDGLEGPAGLVEAVPEDGAGVEHGVGGVDEAAVVGDEAPIDGFLELVHGVLGVLGLEALVKAPEVGGRAKPARGVEPVEAVDEIVPEAGVRPVLDGEGGPERRGEVLGAVDVVEGVAKVERGGGAVLALAEVVEAEADGVADVEEPLEMGGAVREAAALDRAFGREDVVRCLARVAEDDAELVREDLLRLPHRLLRRRFEAPP
mmetsp:Transcript_1027/g.3015  ORF Transcript_1027/g.3015 Transcript_1027/m.3015 type:complete len:223 (-) Transcript_1027:263-931(-)